ncbi:MAG: excinuclease ABC subunit B, partial [Aquificota bacterium]
MKTLSGFSIKTDLQPAGDQPGAIRELLENLESGVKEQVLLGATGTGKTFTIANVIEKHGKPTLIIAHNKILAAQLYRELKELFPDNAVEYFISYYDYYQPEAYIPEKDLYIEKDASINEILERYRHSATVSVLERRDVIVVASVSCIYGLGSPEAYYSMRVSLEVGQRLSLSRLTRKLVEIGYERSDYAIRRATFAVKGNALEVVPSDMEDQLIRVEFWDDEIESIELM